MSLRPGNRGTGSRKSSNKHKSERDVVQHLMDVSPEFKNSVIVKTEESWRLSTDFLLKVVKGEVVQTLEFWDSKREQKVTVEEKPTIADRVRAATVLKAYTLDKMLANKTDREREGAAGRVAGNIVAALQEIEGRRKEEAEKRAVEAGKLAKIGDGVVKKQGG